MSRDAPRLGLIGVGRWGRNIARTVSENRRAVLAGVASRNPRSGEVVPRGCRIVADWRELIADPGLDGVIVATPPTLHPQIVLAALEAQLPILVEKPLALSIEEGRRIHARTRELAGSVMVDHTYLFHPAWNELKCLAADLGAIRAIRSSGGNWGPFRAEMPVLWDWGPHDISMCIDLMAGMPGTVSASRVRAEQTPQGRGEKLRLGLSFATTRAEIEIGNIMPARVRRFEVEFAGTTVVIDDTAEHKLRCGGRAVPIRGTPPLTAVIDAFVDAIAADSFDTDSLELALQVVETLERCDAVLEGHAC